MCGILLSRGGSQPFHHGLLASLRRRGPDAVGFWSSQDLHLAHTRLSIIGLEEAASQPMENERHVIALNGEIYNFAELRRRLLQEGVRFRTSSDTEVLLHAWTRWGRSILAQLTGFWAFIVYDKVSQQLTLVRDQLGIKPLYYWQQGDRLCAASQMRTILEATGETPELDYQSLSEYVRYQFTFGDRTFFRSIKKVLPGHCIEIDLRTGALRDELYEDILRPQDAGQRPFSPALVGEIKELIVRCCQESTVSDTSFTSLCSGGIDSSLITAITQPEMAYHGNYSDPDCNETFFARQMVADLPTRLMVVNAQETFPLIDRLASLLEDFDEITIGSVILPLEDLLSQVKRRYKVVLTGTGGDELFAGYTRYQLALGECYQDSYRALYDRMQRLRGVTERFEYAHRKGNPDLYRFYDPQAEQAFHEHFAGCQNGGGDLQAMLTFDRRYFLSGLLNIDDKLCGRHSLESRPSFLHQDLVRAVLRIAPEALLRDRELKYFLRRAAADFLPPAILRRTDKMGFTTPIGTFINRSAHLIREHIMDSPFRHLYDLHRVHFTAENKFSREVFGLLLLDLWLQRYARTRASAATA